MTADQIGEGTHIATFESQLYPGRSTTYQTLDLPASPVGCVVTHLWIRVTSDLTLWQAPREVATVGHDPPY
jgi:hypothetical protein